MLKVIQMRVEDLQRSVISKIQIPIPKMPSSRWHKLEPIGHKNNNKYATQKLLAEMQLSST